MTQLLQILDGDFAQQKGGGPRARRLLQVLERLAGRGITLVRGGAANTAARLRRFRGVVGTRTNWRAVVIATCNGRRKDRKIDALVVTAARTAVVVAVTVSLARYTAVGPVAARLGPIDVTAIDIGPVTARFVALCVRARATNALRLLVGPAALRMIFALTVEFIVAVIVQIGIDPVVAVVVLVVVVALALLFVEPRAGIAQHPEIMIGELKIIFGLDSVTGQLSIARHALVFFKQLGSIPALAIILAIAAVIGGHAPGLLSTAAATAATLTIVDQTKISSSHWRNRALNHLLEGQSSNPTRRSCAPIAPGPLF